MRDIKFRGKRIDNGEWVYGFLIQYENGLFICNFVGDAYQYHVDPETVGQYTGLKDKNGILIYKGDIVKLPTNHKNRVVLQVKGGFAVEALDSDVGKYGKQTYTPIEGLSDEQNASWIENCEVIGNIYENPELLS